MVDNVHKTNLKNLGKDLDKILIALAAKGEKKATKIMRQSFEDLFTGIIVGTPKWFDGEKEGTARGSWMIQQGSVAPDVTRRQKNKGRNYVKRSLKGFKLGKSYFMSNSVPYINVLEYGGYPKVVKKGSLNPKTGFYEIRSINGFSRQAPEGMVRVMMKQWRRIIINNIRNAR